MTDDPTLVAHLIDRATASMQAACTDSCRMYWARELVVAEVVRGDYDGLIEGPLSEDLLTALAGQKVKASKESKR